MLLKTAQYFIKIFPSGILIQGCNIGQYGPSQAHLCYRVSDREHVILGSPLLVRFILGRLHLSKLSGRQVSDGVLAVVFNELGFAQVTLTRVRRTFKQE